MKKPKQPQDITEMLDRACETLDIGTRAMSACIKRVADMLESAEEFDIKLSSHLAWVTKQHADVCDSLRQLEKHERHMAKTPDARFRLVRAYLRELDSERLAIVRADIAEMSMGSVLS